MKTRIYIYLALFAAFLLSCTKEDNESISGAVPVSFKVGTVSFADGDQSVAEDPSAESVDSKISIESTTDSHTVSWSVGDKVSMFAYKHGTGVVNFSDKKFTAQYSGNTTTFSGYVPTDFSPLSSGFHPVYMIYPAAEVKMEKYVESTAGNYYLMSGLSIKDHQDGTGWKYCWFFSNNGHIAAGSKKFATPDDGNYTLPTFTLGHCLVRFTMNSRKPIKKIEISYNHSSGPGLVGDFKFYTKWKDIAEGCLTNTITIEKDGQTLPDEIWFACRGIRNTSGNYVTFTFTAVDGSVAVKTLVPSVQYGSGKVYNLGTVDVDGWKNTETAQSAIQNMGLGLNLCNSFENVAGIDRNDPTSSETTNARDITTAQTMISTADAGFKSIRIPITWGAHMDDPMSEIDDFFLDRVEEVVNYALDAGLYCIINMHHDTGLQDCSWLYAEWSEYDKMSASLKNIWTQVANHFKDYDHRLLFESYNELVDRSGAWHETMYDDSYKAANALNQDFVDVVRKTGGNNATRNLIVTTYCASTRERTLKAFVMPNDGVKDHLIVQVHSYVPSDFVTSRTDGRAVYYDADAAEIDAQFALIKRYIQDKGYPCIIGEFGAHPKKLEDGSNNDVHRGHHAGDYVRRALKHGVCPMYWYNPMDYRERDTGGWTYPVLKDSLIKAYNSYKPQELAVN